MLSVTLRLLSLVALGVAQTSSVYIWVPPSDSQPSLSLAPKDLVASIVGSVREPGACLKNAQLIHVYVGRQCNNNCTRLPLENGGGTRPER